ncbi:hypothetical protein [Paenibacillus lentus]|uniref:Uncharacterized protein n=1 Tax=Paenibacillus lentus TaxID=1338368 RepID=A0A3S8RTQ3_9BACL|nr:hypothetical protein [Paenibacillus lentus]AZK46163.1 hypothetical protein EIM92_08125 [Paenibacillus lentus]
MLNIMLLLGFLTAVSHYPTTVDSIPQLSVKLAFSPQSSSERSVPDENKAASPIDEFHSMGDVTLHDDRESVVQKKGRPLSIHKNAYSGYTEYQYADITVGLYEDLVYYVHIAASPEKIKVNGRWLSLQKPGLDQVFGEPDYVAEDGDVYIRDLAAIKIYRDPETRGIVGVDLFDTIAF